MFAVDLCCMWILSIWVLRCSYVTHCVPLISISELMVYWDPNKLDDAVNKIYLFETFLCKKYVAVGIIYLHSYLLSILGILFSAILSNYIHFI